MANSRDVNRRTSLVVAVCLAAGAGVPVAYDALAAPPPKPAVYLVGGSWEQINPSAEMLGNQDFYLGGFGFASGHPGNVTALPSVTGGRYAEGVLGDPATDPEGAGAHTRAFAVSDGRATIVLSQIETQGYFNAYKQGPFGENEIRQDAAKAIAALATADRPAPTASQIIVDSDHSHGGPDTAGVWGGVPTSYLKLVHDNTVQAIVDAWKAMQPATLTYGIAHAGVSGEANYLPTVDADGVQRWLLHNQFQYDSANQDMDDEIRVLQARDPHTKKVLDTYVNFGAHPDVLGSSNRFVTGDYPGRVNLKLEALYGGFGMDQVGTLGRTQPNGPGCPADQQTGDKIHDNICSLDAYADEVVKKVVDALATARPLTGDPTVAMNSYLLEDTTTNAVLLAGENGGQLIGAPFARANNAPWYTGSQLGTSYFVGKIGSILLTGGPGEMYPQIWQKVKDTVTQDKTSGITSVMNIGTAGDFLGYIIAPLEAYPEPIKSSVISTNDDSCGDPLGICPDPIGNDNYFFNVSHTFGERLTCDFLRGAGDIVANDSQKYWSTYSRCPAFTNDYVAPPGLDMTFPQQPDLSALPPFQHL